MGTLWNRSCKSQRRWRTAGHQGHLNHEQGLYQFSETESACTQPVWVCTKAYEHILWLLVKCILWDFSVCDELVCNFSWVLSFYLCLLFNYNVLALVLSYYILFYNVLLCYYHIEAVSSDCSFISWMLRSELSQRNYINFSTGWPINFGFLLGSLYFFF